MTPHRPPIDLPPRVVIIGGGFSGAMTAYHLLRRAAEPGAPECRITIIERSGRFGQGPAYSTDCPSHLLNVVAGRMSALPDQPDHFYEWALRSGLVSSGFTRDTFPPRPLYGRYLSDLLAGVAGAPPLERIVDEAIGIARDPEFQGSWTVTLRSGLVIGARAVVLALGNLPPATPKSEGSEFLETWDGYVRDPWAAGALAGIGRDERIGIIGTGLTMFDVVLALDDSGHRGPIVAVSRRGLTPQPHHMRPPYLTPRIDVARFATLRSSVREVQRLVREVASGGGHWTQVMAALRPVTGAIWSGWSPRDRERFLARLRTFWDMHRHRAAPHVADRIRALTRTGRLGIRASRSMSWSREGAAMILRTAGGPVVCDRVINCTGPATDIRARPGPLVASLLKQGLAIPDPLGIGVEADSSGRLRTSEGFPEPTLLVLGGWLRPVFWETTAVQELREQARDRAEQVIGLLATAEVPVGA